MAVDPLDLAKAGIAAVLEHHVPGASDDASAKRVAALIEALADELAIDLLVEGGVLPVTKDQVEEFLSVFGLVVVVPAVLASLRRLSTVGETRH